jgi:hypothetical protein
VNPFGAGTLGRAHYGELFGWEIDSNNPMKYGTVQREGNTNADGVGVGGGVGSGPEGYDGHVVGVVSGGQGR